MRNQLNCGAAAADRAAAAGDNFVLSLTLKLNLLNVNVKQKHYPIGLIAITRVCPYDTTYLRTSV